MTVPVQIPVTASTANGLTNVFPYGFKIAAAEDLAVTVDGVRLTSGYTVSGVGDPAGGNVTITAAPSNGAKVVRYLAPILKRENDYQQFGDWMAAIVNLDIDRIWLVLQTLQQNDIRSLKLPVDTTIDQVIAQDAAARAGKLVSFDASGNMTLLVPADLSLQPVSTFIATLLDDIDAAAARATLGLGSAATLNSGTSPGNLVALNGSGKLPAIDGSLLTNITAPDTWARDNILLLFLRDAITSGIASGAMRDGASDAYLTDTIGANSTGQTYDATNKLYSNTIATSYSNAGGTGNRTGSITVTHSGFVNGTAQNTVDGNNTTAGGNGAYPNSSTSIVGFYLQFDFGVGASKVIDEAKLYAQSGYSLNGTWQWEGSNNGSSWTSIGGTYSDTTAGAQTITTLNGNTTGYRYYRIRATAGATGTGVPWWSEFEFKIADAPLTTNMTLVSNAATAQAAPSNARIVVLHKPVDATTINTDFTAEVSRDGGTTWSAVTLSNVGAYDANYNTLEGTVSVSGQPSGTSMKYRLKTFNTKEQRVKGCALAWG